MKLNHKITVKTGKLIILTLLSHSFSDYVVRSAAAALEVPDSDGGGDKIDGEVSAKLFN